MFYFFLSILFGKNNNEKKVLCHKRLWTPALWYTWYSVYGTLVKYFGLINDGAYSEGALQQALRYRTNTGITLWNADNITTW